jgi:hypothetical protein
LVGGRGARACACSTRPGGAYANLVTLAAVVRVALDVDTGAVAQLLIAFGAAAHASHACVGGARAGCATLSTVRRVGLEIDARVLAHRIGGCLAGTNAGGTGVFCAVACRATLAAIERVTLDVDARAIAHLMAVRWAATHAGFARPSGRNAELVAFTTMGGIGLHVHTRPVAVTLASVTAAGAADAFAGRIAGARGVTGRTFVVLGIVTGAARAAEARVFFAETR